MKTAPSIGSKLYPKARMDSLRLWNISIRKRNVHRTVMAFPTILNFQNQRPSSKAINFTKEELLSTTCSGTHAKCQVLPKSGNGLEQPTKKGGLHKGVYLEGAVT